MYGDTEYSHPTILWCRVSCPRTPPSLTSVACSLSLSLRLLLYIFLDIFFVFVTPLFLDGESVMMTVAKGGNANGVTADDFCYKYPEDKKCAGIDFLPMLLSIPRIRDWRGGSALLGLGDIICKFIGWI
jgi:hypothetical protein